VVTAVVVCVLIVAVFLIKKETHLMKSLVNAGDKVKIFQEKLKNPSYADPDFDDFIIPNVLAVKRTVYLLQWKEIITKGGAEYTAIWSRDFINSDEFVDKTKKNHDHGARYKDLETIYSSEQLERLMIGEKQIAKKILYKNPNLRDLHVNKIFDAKEEVEIVQNSIDFGSDLDKYVFDSQRVNKDIFKLVDNNTLVNSLNLIKPQVGDIKIEYQIFSPNYVIAFVNMSGKKPHIENFIFSETMYNFADSKFVEFSIFAIFIVYSNIVFGAWLFVSNSIKKYSKKFVLNSISLINEYLVFGSSYHFAFFMTFISVSFAINGYVFLLFIIAFACAINRDYFSV
jgi:hypothetical protein